MRRVVASLVVGLVVAGCAGPRPSASPSPNATEAAIDPTTPPSVIPIATPAEPDPTPTPVPMSNCPATKPTTVFEFADADWRCSSEMELSFRGWLDWSPPLGFEGPGIEPGWLPYPPGGQLWALWSVPPVGPDNMCPNGVAGCAWVALHLDPSREIVLGTTPRWVRVTGHVDDPAALECHWVWPDDYPIEERPPDSDAIETCRSSFIVTAIRNVE